MLFSIIIPSYQSKKTIPLTLNSIISQQYKNFEIIIVDGGSDDGTISIVENYIPLHNNIKIISETDKGVYDAMNKGIKVAVGDWLYFLGSDDILVNDKVLQSVREQIILEDADIIYGDVILKSDGRRYAGAFDILKLQVEQNICHQAIFYKKNIFERIGYFNLKYKIWADWDFNIRCFRHTELKCKYADIVIALYNDTGGLCQKYDTIFYEELPIYYITKFKQREKAILNSKEYKIGDKIVSFLRKFKIN